MAKFYDIKGAATYTFNIEPWLQKNRPLNGGPAKCTYLPEKISLPCFYLCILHFGLCPAITELFWQEVNNDNPLF